MPLTQQNTTDLHRACEMVVEIHKRLADFIKPGVTLAQIDTLVGQTLQDLGAKSAFLHYQIPRYPRFPSQSCLSLNDVIVHGTAGMIIEPLKPGDVLSVDIGTNYRGWIGDAAWTYIIEDGTEQAKQLCNETVRSLNEGIEQLQPGKPLRNWAQTIQRVAEQENPFHCVNGLGGHGLGHKVLHGPPHVANAIPRTYHEWTDVDTLIKPGMILAVEPIIAIGTSRVQQKNRQWPIRTADGSIACHYEHDVLITEDGPEVLTAGLSDLPIILA